MIDPNTNNQDGMPPSAGPEPFHIDLTNLTQEQFDLAMQIPGVGRYSSPCIIGAMMPQELRDRLKRIGSDRDSVSSLSAEGLVSLKDVAKGPCAIEQRVQRIFDSFNTGRPNQFNERLERLAELLPHIDVLKHKLPVPVI